MATKANVVKVVQKDELKPMPVEVIAESIKAIAEGIRKVRNGPLNDKALLLLIQHAAPNTGGRYNQSKIGLTEIRAVIEGIESLEATYLKKKPKAV